MSILKVARLGNPVLRQMASEVAADEIAGKEIQQIIRDMVETMREYGGVGLAGPQIHCSLQIAVIEELQNHENASKTPLLVLINPTLNISSEKLIDDWEGCLSIPDLRGRVPRYQEIQVAAYDAAGRKVSFLAEGFQARVIQHEHDHLLGKVFLDRMRDFESLTHLTEFSRYWQK
jgi:peptide deformylase